MRSLVVSQMILLLLGCVGASLWLYEWGAANCVTFDAQKERFYVISRNACFGSSFNFLDVAFDLQLTMQDATHNSRISPQEIRVFREESHGEGDVSNRLNFNVRRNSAKFRRISPNFAEFRRISSFSFFQFHNRF